MFLIFGLGPLAQEFLGNETVFLLLPFTRLVHIWSAPFGYLVRAYQVVRTRRPRSAFPQT